MRKIKFFDTTLRDGEQAPGCSMSLHEKIEVARQLERMKVDVIEAGFAISSPGDFESVKAIAGTVKDCTVASLSRALTKDIDAAYEAVKGAAAPRIHTFIATSPVHMQYKLKMTPDQVLEQAEAMVRYAAGYCSDVEFSAEDAMRSDKEFLARVCSAVIRAGAKVVNIPDTVGIAMPAEMTEILTYLRRNVPEFDRAEISVHCHNDLGMAVANSLAAIEAGATQVECTVNGLGERAGNAALEEIVMALRTRAKWFEAESDIDTTQIYRTSRLVYSIIGMTPPLNKAIVGANAFAHEAGIHQHGVMTERSTYEIMTPESIGLNKNRMVLGKHSGRHAFETRLTELGYKPDASQINEYFEQFKQLCDKKKNVTDGDIEAIITSKLSSRDGSYTLERFDVHSGNCSPATCLVTLRCGEETIEKVAIGDGPVDAAYRAIDEAVGMEAHELEDYAIHSTSEGMDALGEVIVKLKWDGQIITGRGLSTDIIESSIIAYLNGINRIAEMGGIVRKIS